MCVCVCVHAAYSSSCRIQSCLQNWFSVSMNAYSSSTPTPGRGGHTSPPYTNSDLVTRIGAPASHTDIADLAALIGGVISAVLLVLICIIAVLLWCLSRQKGSYATNETEDDDDDDVDEDDDDDESSSSDRALQMKEPLKPKEDD